MASFDSSGRCIMAASTSATMFLYRIVEGLGTNFGPFCSKERSASVRGFCDKFITQLLLSMVVDGCPFFMFSCLLLCLALMVLRMDSALDFKNFVKDWKVLLGKREANSWLVFLIRLLMVLIWLWQMDILAFMQCLLVLSMICLKVGWFSDGLNRRDFGYQPFSSARLVNCRWRWWASCLYVFFSRSLANLRLSCPAVWRRIHINTKLTTVTYSSPTEH